MKYVLCTILISLAHQTHFIMTFSFQTKRLILIGLALGVGSLHAQTNCDDPFASNFEEAGACTYCESVNQLNSSPEEEFTIGSGLSNDHMNVGIDACNGITASLGVLERYVGNVEPQSRELVELPSEQRLCGRARGRRGRSPLELLVECELGRAYVFEDVEVKFGLDFDPAPRLRRQRP